MMLIVPFFDEEVLGWESDLGGVSTMTSDSTSVSASYVSTFRGRQCRQTDGGWF